MIRQQRLPLLQPALRMEIASHEPQEEESKQRAQDRPFGYVTFLLPKSAFFSLSKDLEGNFDIRRNTTILLHNTRVPHHSPSSTASPGAAALTAPLCERPPLQ